MVLEQFAQLETYSDEFLSVYPQGKYWLELYDDAYLLVPFLSGRSLSALVNTEGMVLIGNQLHYFSDEYHVLVANKDKNLLREVIQAPFKDWNSKETGIVVTFQEQDSALLTNDPSEKVQVKFVNCPSEGVAHNETIGSGSNRKRMVVEMFTYLFSTEYSNNIFLRHATLRLNVFNYYRSGWSWQPDLVKFETVLDKSGRFVHQLFSGNNLVASASSFPSNVSVNQSYTDVAHIENLIVASVMLSGPNISQLRFFDQGLRTRAFRTGNTTTSPNLDITVGCN